MRGNNLGLAPDPYAGRYKHNHVASVWAELLFVSLPFVVLLIVFSFRGPLLQIILHPEWAIAASILAGQAVVRLVSPVIKERVRIIVAENVMLLMVMIIVLVLVPSLTVLALILISEHPSVPLGIAQVALFLLAAAVYFYVSVLDDPSYHA